MTAVLAPFFNASIAKLLPSKFSPLIAKNIDPFLIVIESISTIDLHSKNLLCKFSIFII